MALTSPFWQVLSDVPPNALLTADLSKIPTGANCALTNLDTDIDARHNNGAVFACADGHVAYEAFKSTDSKADILFGRNYDLFVMASAGRVATPAAFTNASQGQYTRSSLLTMPFGTYKGSNPTDPVPNVGIEFDVLQTMHGYSTYDGNGFSISLLDSGANTATGWSKKLLPPPAPTCAAW